MTLIRPFLAAVCISGCALVLHACGGAEAATAPTPVTVVSMLDIEPNVVVPGNEDAAQALLRQYLADTRTEAGLISVNVLQQQDATNHFVVVESWQSEDAFNLHTVQASTKSYRTGLNPRLGAPYDQRVMN
jgi:quinol monooxygenase YgiN